MRSAEPLEPEVAAALEAIDATLAGEPVDPDHAELAELSLLLADDAPQADEAWMAQLDRRVASRFAAPERRTRSSNRGLWSGAAVLAAAAVVALVIVVAHPSTGGSSSSSSGGGATQPSAAGKASSASGAGGTAGPRLTASGSTAVHRTPKRAFGPTLPGNAAVPHVGAHRQVAQSAHLALTAAPGRIEGVSQQVFDVIASEHGFVASSHVEAARLGMSTARFSLRVPSGRLQRTLDRLSHLRHARVLARSDASADITGRIRTAAGQLGQDRALHRSLLSQLAAAVTSEEVDHIQAQLRRNDAAIVRDEDALQGLHRRVTDSRISVSIQSPMAVAHHHHRSSGGLTIGRALHDAVRVLVVAAGVALIALAGLIPAGLLAALAAWLWVAARHRRRESTLGP